MENRNDCTNKDNSKREGHGNHDESKHIPTEYNVSNKQRNLDEVEVITISPHENKSIINTNLNTKHSYNKLIVINDIQTTTEKNTNHHNITSLDNQRLVKISSCTLNQWAMDFEGNKTRIIKSIVKSKEEGANIRIGPELEIPGYGCEDHFLEFDTVNHSWQVLAQIIQYSPNSYNQESIPNKISENNSENNSDKSEFKLENSLTHNIICDLGMPVSHNGVLYNCRVLVYNGQVLFIRPKMAMADDGNYRENRWFTPWTKGYVFEDFILPRVITDLTGQHMTKFGIGMLLFNDLSYAPEICEELWIPYSPSIDLTMCGCEIIGNSSGSHFQVNKQERRYELITNSSKKNGGVYIYSNLMGCDGGRLYFDGGAFICANGKILAEGSRFMLDEVEVTTAVVDLNEVATYRSSIKSRCLQSSQHEINVPIVKVAAYVAKQNGLHVNNSDKGIKQNMNKDCIIYENIPTSENNSLLENLNIVLNINNFENNSSSTKGQNNSSSESNFNITTYNPFHKISPKIYTFEEELALAPSCWMWDYLRRSGASGFFLPLSGGADSSCVAVMVALLTRLVFYYITELKSSFVLNELRKILKDSSYIPTSAEEICNLLLVTTYMGTGYSSSQTKENAKNLSNEIGSKHLEIRIDKIVSAFEETFVETFGEENRPKFVSQGGTYEADLALQNIQARTRMVVGYMLAGLVNPTRKRKGFLLVLASANLDEGITGYLTKYDCSSADINPIGSVSKVRLNSFLKYCHTNETIKIKALAGVLNILPSAELRPCLDNKIQSDEEEIGMTFEELSLMGQLRKDFKCGPYSMFRKLMAIWKDRSQKEVKDKVEKFFRRYAVNRHKMTTITPSLHCESYSLDDNRFDLRQFLYNTYWTFQFNNINKFMEDSEQFGIKL